MISRKLFSFFSISLYYTSLIIIDVQKSWKTLPKLVPYHYDKMGQPDRYIEKGGLLVIPFLSIFLSIVFMFLINSPPRWVIPIKLTKNNVDKVKGSASVHLVILSIVINMNLRTFSGLLVNGKPLSIKPLVYSIIGFCIVMLLYRANIIKYEDFAGEEIDLKKENRGQRRSAKRANEAKANNKKRK